MKGVFSSRKADGLKWASKARLFMASNPCVRPPPAARVELEKGVPYAVSYRLARKGHVAVREESMSVHGTTASVNQAARTCRGLFPQGGINRLQNFFRWPPQKPCRKIVVVLTHTTKHRYPSLSCGSSNVTSKTKILCISL